MPQLNTSDIFNPEGVDGEDQIFPLPYIAYASRLGENSPWAASLGVRYIPGDIELRQLGVPADDDSEEFGFNILSFTAGVAYRF